MIAAWMLYALAVTTVLYVAAIAAEYVARALRIPTRLVWGFAMIAAIALSARAFAIVQHEQAPTASLSGQSFNIQFNADSAGVQFGAAQSPSRLNQIEASWNSSIIASARQFATIVAQSPRGINVASLERWNASLVALWIAASLVAFGRLAGSIMTLRHIERRLVRTVVDENEVLASCDIGPALIGVLRPRIVLPEWVVGLPKTARTLILAHEQAHARAFDPALVYAAAVVVALQPWNVALWGIFARLRLSLESDCDKRVLRKASSDDARQYGELLITVYARSVPSGVTPYVAFIRRPSNLERRIRRIMSEPRLVSLSAVMSASVATVLVVTACSAAAPARVSIRSPGALRTPGMLRDTRSQAEPVRQHEIKKSAVAPIGQTSHRSVCSAFGASRDRPSQHGRIFPATSRSEWFPDGCSVFGDVVVVAIDSSRLLFAARDTSEAGISVFMIFETLNASVPASLAWSTTTGSAELVDKVFYIKNSDATTKSIAVELKASVEQKNHLGKYADAIRFTSTNMLISEMRRVPWEKIAQLPNAKRCVPTVPEEELPAPPPAPPFSKLKDEPLKRACFVVNEQRFEFPVP